MLAANQLRVLDLLDRVRTRRVLPDELRDVDPELQSLRNLNTPTDYQAALAAAGYRGRESNVKCWRRDHRSRLYDFAF